MKTSVIKMIFSDEHKYEDFFHNKKKDYNNLGISAVIIHIATGLIILI